MRGVADLALLHALDAADDPESPPGFDWRRAEQSLRAMAHDLAGALGVPALDVEGPESVQDASFHGQVVLPAPALSPGQPGPAILCTSNFGRLAAVRPERAVRPAELAAIRDVLARHGYVYVPASLQDAPYTGPTSLDAHDAPTWWTRYFEYL